MPLYLPGSRVVAMLLAAFVVVGCGADSTTTAGEDDSTPSVPAATSSATSQSGSPSQAPGTPEGWERVESTTGGFAISLPRGWEAVDLTSGDIDAMVELLSKDSRTAPLAEQLPALLEQGVAFFAVTIDAESLATGFATNLNIVVQPEIGMSLDLYVAGNVSFLEGTFDVDVAQSDVELPIGAAVRAEYEAGFGAAIVHQTQYYTLVDARGFIATFSRVAGDGFAELEKEFAAIIATLEVLP